MSASPKGELKYSFTGSYGKADSYVWGRVLWVPQEDIDPIKALGKRFLVSLNESYEYHGSWIPVQGGELFFYINKEVQKTLELSDGDPVGVRLFEDLSEFGVEMLDPFKEVLDQEVGAWDYFRALTPGKQRNLIYFVQNVKSPDIQIRRALVCVHHLLSNAGKIDFKLLNQEMKEANAQFKKKNW